MKRWKAILAASLIFATGMATGALAIRTASRAAEHPRDFRPPSMMDGRSNFLGRLQRDLSLSVEQSARIDVILQEGRKRNRQLWESIQPQIREENKLVNERIRGELNDEQRVKFEETLKRSRERRGPRPEGGGPNQGPGGEGWRRGGRSTNSPAAPGEPGARPASAPAPAPVPGPGAKS